jgi:glycosyltransferase involved in cell wall biosynthesis
MICSADHIVTLTEKAKGILQKNYLYGVDPNKLKQFTVIPTCADFDHFDTRHIHFADRLTTRKALGIGSENIVLGYLGTIAEDYMPDAIFKAFSVLQFLRPKAKFLFVSLTPESEIKEYAKSYGVQEEDVLVVAASREDVPRYLAIFDLAVVFVRPDLSTAGVSPTKLNELFACNIPVIANSGVGDLDSIINPEVNDSILVHNFSEKELAKAFEILFTIISSPVRHGRESGKLYSLDEGCRKYQSIYSQYIQPECKSEH